MTGSPILDVRWPQDLDPSTVPFATRTVTVLRRRGLFDDPIRFDSLTVSEVAGWWDTGPVTIADLRTTAHHSIRRHEKETDLRERLAADLGVVADEPWATRVWFHDPRFASFVPRGDATVSDLVSCGTVPDRRYLFDHLNDLHAAVATQAMLSLDDAVAQYVELISAQHGERLDVLLARTGLNGQDRITGSAAGEGLGVSFQRVYQLERQLEAARDRARSPTGIWMPQLDTAELSGWPDEYTDLAVVAIREFFAR